MADNSSAEIYRRLAILESAIASHTGACTEMNRARDRFEAETKNDVTALRNEVVNLKGHNAWQTGYMAGAAALAGVLGTVLAKFLFG